MQKKLFLLMAIALSATQLCAHAININIKNNTDTPGVGYISGKYATSPCSSTIGNAGIVQPHSSIDVPEYVISLIYCSMAVCKGHIYMANNCADSPEIATITVDKNKGVTEIVNHNVNGYVVSGSGSSIAVNGGPSKKWYNFLF